MSKVNLSKLSTNELLSTYAQLMTILRERGIIRSENNPLADYAEWLVQKTLSLKLANKSTAGYDAVDFQGKCYEIKARRLTPKGKTTHLSAFRGLEEKHFDYLVSVIFNQDFSINRGAMIPFELVREEAQYKSHVNGWHLYVRDIPWDATGVEDLTDKLRKALEN